MESIVIPQAEVRLSMQQLIAALRQLPTDDQERIWREMSALTWEQRFDALLTRVQQRGSLSGASITDAEIDAEVEAVRSARHAQSGC